MASDLSPLVADDGELRLARRVASYVYGRREVTWPEGVDDPEDDLPDEREFGWVAKLPGPEPGLSERRFVRGDVQIDAVEQVSNVEQVLDDAASRAGGDVFFESMIEGRGLGRLVPGRDFDEGDLVDVRFWGRILPDQLVTAVEWHDGVPSVKLGGQALSDVDDLGRARAEALRLIRRERAEREGDVAKVSAAASTAQSTADAARSEVAAVRESLAGEQAGEPDLLAQLVAVNDELQRLGQDPQPSLMLAFVALSTALWQAQHEINAQQQLINEQQATINAQQNEINTARATATDALYQAQLAASRDMTRMLFADREQSAWDAFLQIKMPKFNQTVVIAQRGPWSGTVILQLQYSSGGFYQRGRTMSGGQVWTETIPLGAVANAIVFYQVQTGAGYGVGESDN